MGALHPRYPRANLFPNEKRGTKCEFPPYHCRYLSVLYDYFCILFVSFVRFQRCQNHPEWMTIGQAMKQEKTAMQGSFPIGKLWLRYHIGAVCTAFGDLGDDNLRRYGRAQPKLGKSLGFGHQSEDSSGFPMNPPYARASAC